MNIHIDKNTPLQSWQRKTVFNEYPLYIRAGKNFTVTLMFYDADAIRHLNEMLLDMLMEINEGPDWLPPGGRLDEALS